MKERPLSPHLQIYKPQITSILSVFHRGTGVFLAFGNLLLVCWVSSIASGAEAYANFQAMAGHWFGLLMLLGWSFSLFYHLCNGIRHLLWDIGKNLDIKDLYTSGWIVVICSILMTAATWFFAISKNGGLS